MDAEGKIRVLNRILAARSAGEFAEKFLESSKAIDFAFKRGVELASLADFAKSIVKIYDADADLEFIDLGDDYFDPLFKIDEISAAAKRLAGCEKPILVISGLEKSSRGPSKRWSEKKRGEYFSNLNIVEGHVLRYESAIPHIEIIFI